MLAAGGHRAAGAATGARLLARLRELA